MPDLRNALFAAGLASERQLKETEARERLEAEMDQARMAKRNRDRAKRLEILRKTSAPCQFRRQARKLLLQDPDLLQEIINLAHSRGLKKKPEGNAMIANLLQIRNTFKYHPELQSKQRIEFIDRLFSNK